MKNRILLFITVLITGATFAQQGINYKAFIKDDLGNVVANQDIEVRFFILKSGGGLEYNEDHLTTTNTNGLVILTIGKGVPGQLQDFSTIDWSEEDYTLRVGIDLELDGSFVYFDNTPFNTVPYAIQALRASEADNAATKIDELSDAKSDNSGSSVFIGLDSGLSDDGSNNRNVAIGFEALKTNTTGYNNVVSGHSALKNNTTGHSNTAQGTNALISNTEGNNNTAIGTNVLIDNTGGNNNTATGVSALESNLTGNENTANGYLALRVNRTGFHNTAIGSYSLSNNSNGGTSTAIGHSSLRSNISGHGNTAVGYYTLTNNTEGDSNTAMGNNALYSNTIGSRNTAYGPGALSANTTGNGGVAIGSLALDLCSSGNINTATGTNALRYLTSGGGNTAIGADALRDLTSGENNIGIGWFANVPNAQGSNQIRIGNYSITSASMQVGWSITSDKRWKDNIRKLPYGLDMVMQLQPVDYTRKNNTNKTREMGFIAQDLETLLEKVGYKDQGFLTKDDDGYLSVRYNDLIALLTKALQEQQSIIDTQNSKIDTLSTDNSSLKNTVNNLVSRVEKIEVNNQ